MGNQSSTKMGPQHRNGGGGGPTSPIQGEPKIISNGMVSRKSTVIRPPMPSEEELGRSKKIGLESLC